MFSRTQKFGNLIERWVAAELRGRGWSCRLIPDWQADFDIMLNDFLPVEVKAARSHRHRAYKNIYRDRWQFDLSRGLNPMQSDFLYILVAVDNNGELWPYVIPSAWTVGHSLTPVITSHPLKYRGWLSGGLNNWQNVDLVMGWRYKYLGTETGQLALPLFEGVLQ